MILKVVYSNRKVFIVVIFLKLILMSLFSSDYKNILFVPFIEYFIQNLNNPYEYFYNINSIMSFPYPPLMLYISSFFYLPFYIFGLDSILLQNFFFKIPTFLADILIYIILIKIFPTQNKKILFYYFLNPIILYSAYMHSQLDLIPTSILMLSIFFLIKNRVIFSAILISISISVKFHTIIAIPLMIAYIYKQNRYKTAYFIIFPIIFYLLFTIPYIFSDSYLYMVIKNPKQMMLFDSYYQIENLKIYLPVLVISIIYVRFLNYHKINRDLLFSYFGVLFSVLLLLISPSPAWYIWIVPFLSIFFIQNHSFNNLALYIVVEIFYLIYFLIFFKTNLVDIQFLHMPIEFKIENENLKNLFFTFLESFVIIVIYQFYKEGIKSNEVYKKDYILTLGIAGDSGVGKSTLMNDLKSIFNNKLTELEGDGDHKWERGDLNWQKFTHLDPKANFLHRQANDLANLKSGKPIFRIDYNHNSGKFTESRKIKSNEIIALSGLHPFYLPKMRKFLDIKIYIDTQEELRRHWKVIRDTKKRGYSIEKIIKQIEDRSEDFKKYIYPQKKYADLIVKLFADSEFQVGDIEAKINLKLKIVMDANIHIETLVNYLLQNNKKIEWDYLEDLKYQYIILHDKLSISFIEEMAYEFIENLNDLIGNGYKWEDSYRGFLQFIVLLIISDKLKEHKSEV